MPDFSSRSYQEEKMDDLESSGQIIDQTLKELKTINKLLGGNAVTLEGISDLLSKTAETPNPLRIIDMGCGGGDILKLIERWSTKRRIPVNLTGIDANPNIIDFARKNNPGSSIRYETRNIFDPDLDCSHYDIVICTLFLHHFNELQISQLLAKWGKARIGVVVNDLHRHWFAYYSIKLLTALFSRSDMVKSDAPTSVLRAFHKRELSQLVLNHDGMIQEDYSLTWRWAFRWKLVIKTR